MAKSQTLTINLRIEGARETLAAFRRLPKEANNALRDRATELAEDLATKVRAAATAEGAQAALMAPTVKARRDRVPVIAAGGTKKVGRNRKPAFKLLFASEFGMNRRTGWYARPKFAESTGRQYKPHQGRFSYWFFKTVEDNSAEISTAWRRAADDIQRGFVRDGA